MIRAAYRFVATLVLAAFGLSAVCMGCKHPMLWEPNRNKVLRDRHKRCPPLKGRW